MHSEGRGRPDILEVPGCSRERGENGYEKIEGNMVREVREGKRRGL
jgi:hypothetical protein